MKERIIGIIAISGMAIVIAFLLFRGNASMKEARKHAANLQIQVDSLAHISRQYKELRKKYAAIYQDLGKTRTNLSELKEKLEKISEMETSSIRRIREELSGTLARYDSVDFDLPVPSDDLDSLLL